HPPPSHPPSFPTRRSSDLSPIRKARPRHPTAQHTGGDMAFTFDSLAYAKHLRDNGVPQNQAEAHAEAAKMLIMNELVTKEDLRRSEEHTSELQSPCNLVCR